MTSPSVVTRRIVESALQKPDGFIENQMRMILQDAAVRFGPEGARIKADQMISDFQDRMRRIA